MDGPREFSADGILTQPGTLDERLRSFGKANASRASSSTAFQASSRSLRQGASSNSSTVRCVDYFGKTLEELKQWGTGGMTHPEDLPRVVELFGRSVASGEPFEFEVRARRFDGVYRWFQSRGFPLRDANGQIVRWYNLLIDIDERKRAADALRRSENFLLEVQRLSHTGGWRYDAATDTVESSLEIRRGYDVQPGEDASRPPFWFERIHPDDRARVQADFERCLREGTAYQAAYRIVRPDGGIRYQHVTGHPVVSDAGELVEFVGAAMDMTEHWQATKELERASEALRELQVKVSRAAQVATVSELAASIAHEVNQPLSGIITNANTGLRMLAADPPNLDGARETVRRTLRDGNRAADVITRLRALFSKKAFAVELAGSERGNARGRFTVVESPPEKPGHSSFGARRRASGDQRRSHSAPAGHPEPAPQRVGRNG